MSRKGTTEESLMARAREIGDDLVSVFSGYREQVRNQREQIQKLKAEIARLKEQFREARETIKDSECKCWQFENVTRLDENGVEGRVACKRCDYLKKYPEAENGEWSRK